MTGVQTCALPISATLNLDEFSDVFYALEKNGGKVVIPEIGKPIELL